MEIIFAGTVGRDGRFMHINFRFKLLRYSISLAHAVWLSAAVWILGMAKKHMDFSDRRMTRCRTDVVLKIYCTWRAHVYIQFTTFAHTHWVRKLSVVAKTNCNTQLLSSSSLWADLNLYQYFSLNVRQHLLSRNTKLIPIYFSHWMKSARPHVGTFFHFKESFHSFFTRSLSLGSI